MEGRKNEALYRNVFFLIDRIAISFVVKISVEIFEVYRKTKISGTKIF
ncbi:MAG: hypothetical protein LBJ90_07290 [Treponema sp.]|nr:hypothetical protein [Treponema sp.]